MKSHSYKTKDLSRDAILLCSTLDYLTPGQVDQLQELLTRSDFPWTNFMGQSYLHRVTGIITTHLNRHGLLRLCPTLARRFFETIWDAQRVRNHIYMVEHQRLCQMFLASGIKVAATKGIWLLHNVYTHLGQREMNDMDLLISVKDAVQISELLSTYGYCQVEYDLSTGATKFGFDIDTRQLLNCHPPILSNLEVYENEHQLPPFAKVSEVDMVRPYIIVDVALNIFWRGNNEYHYDTDVLLDRSSENQINESKTFLLNPVDELIHLCLHMYEDMYSSWSILVRQKYGHLSKLIDINECFKRLSPMQQAELIDTVKFRKLTTPVGIGLHTVYTILGGSDLSIVANQMPIDEKVLDHFGLPGESESGQWLAPLAERFFDEGRLTKVITQPNSLD